MNPILQLNVTLDKTEPSIWRRVLVPASVSFFDLHHILQIAMGWTNSHLFEFQVGDYKIGYVEERLDDFEDVADANEVTLDTLLLKKGLVFRYLYDFGDYWQHAVAVENVLQPEPQRIYPVCIDGALRCPPEDCGSISGFYEMLRILKDKKHPEHRDTKVWVGRGYNPEIFNIGKVNRELPRYRKYMKHWED